MANLTFNVTTEDGSSSNWKSYLKAFKILSIITLSVLVWLLLCVVVYGSKTRRWCRRRASSSLNSGPIYVTFTLVLLLIVIRVVVTIVAHVLPSIPNWSKWCEIVYHVNNTTYIVSVYASYMFLWFLQRLIHEHPYVKPHIERHVRWLSGIFGIVFSILAVGMVCAFVIKNPVSSNVDGCVLAGNSTSKINQGIPRNVISAAILLVAQIAIIYLCIYPAAKVTFKTGSVQDLNDNDAKKRAAKKGTVREFITSSIRSSQPKFAGPVEMSVKRAMASSIIMVITDAAALLFSYLAFPVTAPVVLRQTIYDISSLVNAFAMLATFGFAVQVLTLCCPSRKRPIERGRARSGHVTEFPENLDKINSL